MTALPPGLGESFAPRILSLVAAMTITGRADRVVKSYGVSCGGVGFSEGVAVDIGHCIQTIKHMWPTSLLLHYTYIYPFSLTMTYRALSVIECDCRKWGRNL